MEPNQIREQIFAVMKGIAPEVNPDDIQSDAPLRDQVDLDSMDYLNFLIGLHQKLGVEIPEEDYGKLTTLDKLVAYLSAKMPG